jgi:glucokinase
MSGFPRLLADVGGTNARFAWRESAAATITDVAILACRDHPRLQDAARAYLLQHAKPAPRCAAIAIATPIAGDAVKMTNNDWSFSIAEMQRELGLERLHVLNDFTALALALPILQPGELVQFGGGICVPGAPMALLGPGTGLGVSGLLSSGPGQPWIALAGEGGHVTLAAQDEREERVIGVLRRRYGHVSGERAVSGPGLLALYEAVCVLDGLQPLALTPSAVMDLALADPGAEHHGPCAEALQLLCAFLGTLAGDLALTLGARGGVFIGGGIVPRLGARFAGTPFRERFEAKGRFSAYVGGIATFVIDAPMSPALRGADRSLD